MEEGGEGGLTLCGGSVGEEGRFSLGRVCLGPSLEPVQLSETRPGSLPSLAETGQARQEPGAPRQDLSQHPHLPCLRLRPGYSRLHPGHLSPRLRACYSSLKCKYAPEPHSLGIPSAFILHIVGSLWLANLRKTQRKGRGRGFGEIGQEDLLLLGRTEAGKRVDELPSFKMCPGQASLPWPTCQSPPPSTFFPSLLLPTQAGMVAFLGPLTLLRPLMVSTVCQGPSILPLSFPVPSHCCRQGNRG